MKLLLLFIFIINTANAQVVQNGNMESVDAFFGRLYDRVRGNRNCNTEANFDEYRQVRCGIDGRYGYGHVGDDSWGDGSLTPEVFQEVTDNVVFQSAAASVYNFNQCQVNFYNTYDGQDASRVDLQNRAYNQFRVVRAELDRLDMLNEERTNEALAQVRVATMSGAPGADRRISRALERSGAENESREETMRQLMSSVPMGNRPQMQTFLVDAARANLGEQAFKSGYHRVMQTLQQEANMAFANISSLKVPGRGESNLLFNVNRSMKRSLMQDGIVENILAENNLQQFNESNYMCRYRSQARGEYVHIGAQVAFAVLTSVATGGAATPYLLASLRAAAYLTTISRTAGGATRLASAVNAARNSRVVTSAASFTGRTARAVQNSRTGRYLFTGSLLAYDASILNIDIQRECITQDYMTSKSSGDCNGERQMYEVISEADTAGCILGIAGFGLGAAGSLSSLRAISRTEDIVSPEAARALARAESAEADEVARNAEARRMVDGTYQRERAAEAAAARAGATATPSAPARVVESEPIVVTGSAGRREFAIDGDTSIAASESMRNKGIIPGERPLTAEELASLTPTERAVYFEEIVDIAMDSRQLSRVHRIFDDVDISIEARRRRLTDILSDGSDNMSDAKIEAAITKIEESGVLGGRRVGPDLTIGATRAHSVGSSPSSTNLSPGSPAQRISNRSNTNPSSGAPVQNTINEPDFIQTYQSRVATNVDQNVAFRNRAISTTPPQGSFFIDLQNRRLKELNDSLENKPLIDAINSRHNEMVQDAISNFIARNRDSDLSINAFPYSDYKGIRFAIEAPPGMESRLMGEFQALLSDVETRFMRELDDQGFVSLTAQAKSEPWFGVGVARTAGEANVLARSAPGTTMGNIRDLWRSLNTRRISLEQTFGNTPLMRVADESTNAALVPTEEVFELLRKKSNASEIAQILNGRYSLNPRISTDQVGQFQQYFREVDSLSPGLIIPERAVHNFSDAAHGGITLDFAGVGSLNARATAEGLARGLTVEQVIARTLRANERITARLDEHKRAAEAAFEEVLARNDIEVRITTSGDDMVAIPSRPLTHEIRSELIAAQARATEALDGTAPSSVRISFFREGIDDVTAKPVIAAEGELFEKALRSRLEGILTPAEQSRLTIATDMLGTARGSSEIRLLTNRSLPPARMSIVRENFNALLRERASPPQ